MENRLDVAEHMYEKAGHLKQHLAAGSAELVADTLYEIGQGLIARKDFTLAIKWLERSQEFLATQPMDQLSRDAIELKLAISQSLVQSLLGANKPETLEKAESIVDSIELDVGSKFVVLLLRLELLKNAPAEVFDSHAYGHVLRRIKDSVELSETTFTIIVHHLQYLYSQCADLACQIMDEFLKECVVPSKKNEWLAKTIVLRTFMSTNRIETGSMPLELKELFDVLSDMEIQVPADAALAVLTVSQPLGPSMAVFVPTGLTDAVLVILEAD
jgi:hypothetical protein